MEEANKKDIALKYINGGLTFFFGLSFISSQYSVALSSIGDGGLIILVAARLILTKEKLFQDKTLSYLFLAFIFVQILSSIFCYDPAESFHNIFRRVALYPIFFSVFWFIKDLKQLRKLLLIFFIISVMVSSVEIVRYLLDFFKQSSKPLSEYRLEYYGFPITNGEIKMLILLLMIPFILAKDSFVTNRWLIALMALPVAVSLFFTNSRNAMLGLFVALLIIGILKYRIFLVSIVVFAVVFLIAAPSQLTDRVLSIVDMNHPSNHSRFVMWETGIRMIKDKPVLGFGDVDNNIIYSWYKKAEIHGEGSHMHSNIFQILVMHGIPGFLCWLAIMLYIFWRQIKVFMRTRKLGVLNTLVLVSLVSMIAFQISGLTEWNFGDAEFEVVMWFNLGLVFLVERLLKEEPEAKEINA